MNTKPSPLTRREALASTGALLGARFAAGSLTSLGEAPPVSSPSSEKRFVYCLNTATIRGQKLELEAEIELAAKAGYDAIEPWLTSIHRHADNGGSLKDLGK